MLPSKSMKSCSRNESKILKMIVCVELLKSKDFVVIYYFVFNIWTDNKVKQKTPI